MKPTPAQIRNLQKIMKTATSIELHVTAFDPVKRFYSSIGFDIIYDNPGNYLVVKKGNAILNFWGEGRYDSQKYFRKFPKMKKGYDVEIIIPIKNVKKYYKTIKNKVKIVEELKERRWRAYDFRIEDPN
jgi:hypothetical protein